MTTHETETLRITIDAPFDRVSRDLADGSTHPEWGTEFFAAAMQPAADGSFETEIPALGGPARYRVDADPERGIVDIYLAPAGADFGPPLPVRILPNGDGVDVLWTLARPPGSDDAAWSAGLDSMRRELGNLKARHEVA